MKFVEVSWRSGQWGIAVDEEKGNPEKVIVGLPTGSRGEIMLIVDWLNRLKTGSNGILLEKLLLELPRERRHATD